MTNQTSDLTFTSAAYTRHRNDIGRPCSAAAVSQAISSGRLKECIVRDHLGRPRITSFELADQEWERNTDTQRRINAGGGKDPLTSDLSDSAPDEPDEDGFESVASATQRLKAAQADLKELELRERKLELVEYAEVKRTWADRLSQMRTKLLGIPTRARQAIPSLTTSEVLTIENLVREALEDLVTAAGEPIDPL